MREIKIDEDVFDELLKSVIHTGKSFSEVIRAGWHPPRPSNESSSNQETSANESGSTQHGELAKYLTSPQFMSRRAIIDKFLGILSFCHDQDPERFEKVESITGRRRKYFSRDRTDLNRSGSSVFPKQIPGSSFWVISNTSTDQKKRILEDALRVLGYDSTAVREAKDSLV